MAVFAVCFNSVHQLTVACARRVERKACKRIVVTLDANGRRSDATTCKTVQSLHGGRIRVLRRKCDRRRETLQFMQIGYELQPRCKPMQKRGTATRDANERFSRVGWICSAWFQIGWQMVPNTATRGVCVCVFFLWGACYCRCAGTFI